MQLVQPEVHCIGQTYPTAGFFEYLRKHDYDDFINDKSANTPQEKMVSCFAKLCYDSFNLEGNENLTKVRSVADNFKGIIDSGHGSVLEHITFNFVFDNVSRVFTHELVRHRVGTAFSQESGRYVKRNGFNYVCLHPEKMDPKELEALQQLEQEYIELKKKDVFITNFAEKKKRTSVRRRMLPNGMANRIGVSFNLRSLRFVIEKRTSRHAEEEMRYVFNKVVEHIHPVYLTGAVIEEIDGYLEYKNLIL